MRLRRPLTPPEAVIWAHVRAKRLSGLKFRRQHPMGPWVADFYCAGARLVVEIDGAMHGTEERRAVDRARDAWMREQGIEVLRFTAREVAVNVDGVLKRIAEVGVERQEMKAKET